MDGRLLVPATGAWLGALSGIALTAVGPVDDRHRLAVLVAWATAGLLVAVVAASGLLSRRTRRRSARRAAGRGLLPALALACLLAGVLSAALQVGAMTAQPVAGWVQDRATATVQGTISGEPVVRRAATGSPWLPEQRREVALATDRVCARGACVEVDLPVLLRLAVDDHAPPQGTRVIVRGRLGPLPGSWPAAATVSARSAGIAVVADAGWLDSTAHDMRVGLSAALAGAPQDGAALVAGLAVGDTSSESEALADAMRASGLSHLTAVSGGNVAVVILVVMAAVGLLGLPLVLRVAAALMALGFFVILVGPQASVLRAAVMGAVVLVGTLTGGRRSGPSVLAAAVLVLAVACPELARTWAFALSVGATAGLILLAPRIARLVGAWRFTRRWPPALREAVAVTLAAQVATLPILLLMGAAVGWVALPANLLAMPVVPFVTVLGLAAALSAPWAPAAAALLAHAAAWPAAWIALVAGVSSHLPVARLPWPSGVAGALSVGGLVLAGWALHRWWARIRADIPVGVLAACCGLSVAMLVLWVVLPPSRRAWPPPDWLLVMCDVGQGDALLLRAGPRSAVVVDAGPDPARVDSCLNDAGVAEVPAVVLTHFHADHVEGLPGVLDGRQVGAVLTTPVRDPPEEATAVDAWLSAAGLHAEPISAGDVRTCGQLSWTALWPRRVITEGSIPNNASVVLEMTVSGRSFLLTGDIELAAQAAIIADLGERHFDVVKVPHHGSRAQDPDLVSAAPAAVALISVGAGNVYGHPAAETVDAWAGSGARVLRTDRDGAVAIVPLGMGVGIVTQHGSSGPGPQPADS